MQCHDIEELMPAWLEGSLDAAAAQRVEQHVTSCAACREFQRVMVEATAVLQAAPRVEPSAELVERAFQAAMRAALSEEVPFLDVLVAWAWRFAFGGAALAAAAAGLLFIGNGASSPDTADAVRGYVTASDMGTDLSALGFGVTGGQQ